MKNEEIKYRAVLVGYNQDTLREVGKYIFIFYPNIVIYEEVKSVLVGEDIINRLEPEIVFIHIKEIRKKERKFIDLLAENNIQIIVIGANQDMFFKVMKKNEIGFVSIPILASSIKSTLDIAIERIGASMKIERNVQRSKKYIAISMLTKTELIEVKNIVFCEAQGRYTVFNLKREDPKIASKNLGLYESMFDLDPFYRIHHKYLINLNHVKEIITGGKIECVMDNGQALPISTRRYKDLRRYLLLK